MDQPDNKFRKMSTYHDEVRKSITKGQADKTVLTIWQGDNIRGATIRAFAKVTSDITLVPIEEESNLEFDKDQPIFLYCEQLGLFIKTKILDVNFQAHTIKVAYPRGKNVKLLENRDKARIDALDKKVSITIKKLDQEGIMSPELKLTLVNISRGGMAIMDKRKICPKFDPDETLLWLGINNITFNKPVNIVVLYQSFGTQIRNLGPQSLLGVKFEESLDENKFIRLLDKLL